MSHKQEALDEIVRIARSHGISLQELAAAFQLTPSEEKSKSSGLAAQIFGYIGGLLMLGGVAVLIGMRWEHLSPHGHILITLIPGFMAFLGGIFCARREDFEKGATPLFLLAASIEPTGILIALKEYAHGDNPALGVLFMCFVMLLQQGLVFLALQRTVLAFTSILFGLSFFGTAFDMQGLHASTIGLIIGLTQLSLAYALGKSPHRSLAPFNYFMGSALFLSAYADWVMRTPFELSYLGMTGFFIYMSTQVRSRILLGMSALAMLAFISYYSARYFAGAIGWPITLIVVGGLMIGCGLMVVKINKRYISQR